MKQAQNTVKKKGFLKQCWTYRAFLLMLLPAVIYFLVFSYVPMGGLVMAFKKYDYSLGMFGSPWHGFKNFEFLFKSGKVVTLFVNTMLYNIMFLITGTIMELLSAVILAELSGKIYKKICQSVIFLPYFVSMVVVGAVVYNLLNYRYGFLNNVFEGLGMDRVNFYVNAGYWPVILILINIWKGVGYGSVVYLASITGIDQEIHEAAKIDGASILQRIRYITLPCLKPTVITLLLMKVGSIFRGNFDLFWNTVGQNSMLYSTTDVIDTYVYRSLLEGTNYGMTTAAGMLQSVTCFLMIITVNGIVKKFNEESALF